MGKQWKKKISFACIYFACVLRPGSKEIFKVQNDLLLLYMYVKEDNPLDVICCKSRCMKRADSNESIFYVARACSNDTFSSAVIEVLHKNQ